MHKYLLGVNKLDAWERDKILKEIERVYYEKMFDNLLKVLFIISMICFAVGIFS